jgi:hypothetical protein
VTIHLHLTVQQMPSGKWIATVRRDQYALQRPFDEYRDACRWLVENTKAELADDTDRDAAA